ncbi:AAA family ATPase [Candidatus Woesearchaeota archaeon]|nr:AAA family ATPase [Candidatus Woesearchaeota archaeon]
MQLNSIKLENIRSYTTQEIQFPAGSVLLSGDIGSGKSTILLAIEFALFGIRRKHLTGNALLRNGKNTGSVELKFNLNSKEIIIKRTLKRGKKETQQDSGYIIIDGVKKSATPQELKTIILDLLGYPKELISKTKNLVYRYTVYTPQEEMKQILVEDEAELRLDTLRKVFGIDKYKRVRENSQIILRQIRENKKESTIKIEDLEENQRQKSEKLENIKIIDSKIQELLPKLQTTQENLTKTKENIEKIEKTIQEQRALKQELSLSDIELRNRLEQRTRNNNDLIELENQINALKKELEGKTTIDIETIQKNLEEINKKTQEKETRLNEINNSLNENKIKRIHAREVKLKILKIAKCPTCEQSVSKEHKESILERENKKIEEFDRNILKFQEEAKLLQKQTNELRKTFEETKKQENIFQIYKIKLDNFKEKENLKTNILLAQEKLKEEIGNINAKKIELNKKIKVDTELEQSYQNYKTQLEELQNKEKQIEIAKHGFEREKQHIKENILSLEEKIKKQLEIKAKLKQLKEMQNWLEKQFINLMAVIEKQVMLNIHKEFNELFQQWFNILMEDENLNVRIDEQFTPLAEQNGYEINISYLSGGERTSAALAYRLALNKVINDVMGTIKTKDVLILDEPTEGFSSEQLDKVREVLEQIGVKQIIVVSHENKIESFVNNVVRINKNEHVSEIIS